MFEWSREEVELHWMACIRRNGRLLAEFEICVSTAFNSPQRDKKKYLKEKNEIGLLLDEVFQIINPGDEKAFGFFKNLRVKKKAKKK